MRVSLKPFAYVLYLLVLVGLVAACGWLQAPADSEQSTSTEDADVAVSGDGYGGSAEDAEAGSADVASEADVTGEITFVGSTTVQPLVEQLAEAFQQRYPGVNLSIGAGGSVVGIQAIQDAEVDIGMSSRSLRGNEQTAGMETHQIAIDVLAVIVHPDNSVAGLTKAELQGIYLGEITNWSEVGGADVAILPVVREVTSGTRGAFDEIALDDQEPTLDADVQITASEVEARVATTENAIGYVGFGHIEEDEIKVLEIDGVMPSPEAAQAGDYQLQRPLLLLTGPLSRDLADLFIEFALSEQGQQIVATDGWLPVDSAE